MKRLLDFFGADTALDESMRAPRRAQAYQKKHEVFFLSDHLPYESWEEDFSGKLQRGRSGLFLNRGGMGFVFEVSGLIGCSDSVKKTLEGFFQHSLPKGSHVQFLLFASPNIGPMVNHWARSSQGKHPIAEELTHQRAQFYMNLENTDILTPRDFRFYVSCSVSCHSYRQEKRQELIALRQTFEGLFEAIGMWFRYVDPTSLIDGMDEIFHWPHPPKEIKRKWNPLDSLSGQMTDKTLKIRINEEDIERGPDHLVRAYGVAEYPDDWSQELMTFFLGDLFDEYRQIKCPFAIHYGFFISDSASFEKTIDGKRAYRCNMASSPIARMIPSIREEARDWITLKSILEEQHKIVRTRYQVFLFSRKEEIADHEQALHSVYRSLRWNVLPEKYQQLHSFLSILPMSWASGAYQAAQNIGAIKTTTTHELSKFTPLQTEWKGNDYKGIPLFGRRGQLSFVNIFETGAMGGNFNAAVVGESGSGKSVFMQEMVMNVLATGGRAFVLDVGRSFKKMCHLLDGQYVEFDLKKKFCINPFSTISAGNKDNVQETLEKLTQVVAIMSSPKDGTKDLEDTYISQAIRHVWDQYGNEANMTHIAEYLKAHHDKIAQNIGTQLFPYTKDGSYGAYFNGKSTVDMSARFVVIEFEQLSNLPKLQAVILQMVIMEVINRFCSGSRQDHGAAFIDEAWKFIGQYATAKFIEAVSRTLRKHGSALVLGTQSIDDFFRNDAIKAAFENMNWTFILKQKKEAIASLDKTDRIVLTDFLRKQLESLKTIKKKYSEIAILGQHGCTIGRLALDPFSRILYSSTAQEFKAVENYVAQGMTLPDAVNRVAKEVT